MDMKMCYALQPGFYQTFSKAGDITVLFHEMQEQQRNKILIAIDVASLQKSAEAFFQKEIQRSGNCLYYDHFLKSCIYEVEIQDGVACLNDCTNPFYQLLKRKYSCLIVQEVDK